MKKLACVAVAAVAVSLMGAALYISQDQALVSGALGELKFESVAGKPGLIGAPSRYRVTKQTIDFLDKLAKEGKQIEVQPNGQVKIVAAK
jgi:hypothetical protein